MKKGKQMVLSHQTGVRIPVALLALGSCFTLIFPKSTFVSL